MISPHALSRIVLKRGDITKVKVDAIVNAANESLLGGGGVDGAIHQSAGPRLLNACQALNGCPTGSAKISPGFDLPAKFVIHAVGPRYRDGKQGESDQLESCYKTAIRLATKHNCETMAFAAISCGVYGYPIAEAARISITAVADVLSDRQNPQEVVWLLFNDDVFDAFQAVLSEFERTFQRK
jgi:O-acetyl-ADP-ribose deacetylase